MILLINDNKDIIAALTHELNILKYQVIPAFNGKEALQHLDNPAIKIILCDYAMPIMNGEEFREIQMKSHPHIPFVLLCNQSDIATKARRMNASAYLDMFDAMGEKGMKNLERLVSEHALAT